MARTRIGIVLAVALIGGATIWLLVSASNDDGPDGVRGQPRLQTAPSPGSRELVERPSWQLVVTPEQQLQLFQDPSLISTVGGYARPVTLDQASSFLVSGDGHKTTLVAGPVSDQAVRVTVATPSGAKVDAQLVTAHDLQWFWAVLPGRVAISAIEALDGGATVDEYTLPAMPPPGPVVLRRLAG